MNNLDYLLNVYNKPIPYTYNDLLRCINSNNIYDNDISLTYLDIFISQIQFLDRINIKKICNENEHVNILYIGSHKAYHLPLINELYKDLTNIKWYLYDNTDPCITVERLSYNITFIRSKFKKDDMIKYKYKKPLILIYEFINHFSNKELLQHHKLQYEILIYLSPIFSLVKFVYLSSYNWLSTYNKNKYIATGIRFLPIIRCYHTRLHLDNKNIITLLFDKNEAEEYYQKIEYFNTYYFNKIINYDIAAYVIYIVYKYNIPIIDIQNSIYLNISEDNYFRKI